MLVQKLGQRGDLERDGSESDSIVEWTGSCFVGPRGNIVKGPLCNKECINAEDNHNKDSLYFYNRCRPKEVVVGQKHNSNNSKGSGLNEHENNTKLSPLALPISQSVLGKITGE